MGKGFNLSNLQALLLFVQSFYETFERYTSRMPGQDPLERVHATPGYPRTITGGLTIRLFPKAR